MQSAELSSWLPAALASYLLGAVPFGLVLTKLVKGTDLRRFGSGNIGATNAWRALGPVGGIVVYLLDFGKGLGPVILFPALFGIPSEDARIPVFLGAAAILGHCFPVYLGFRGGKGVATLCGAMVGLDPFAFGLAAGVWVVVFALTRYVSVASMTMALSLPFFVYYADPAAAGTKRLALLVFSAAVAVFILFTHRENIRRLAGGTEPRAGCKSE